MLLDAFEEDAVRHSKSDWDATDADGVLGRVLSHNPVCDGDDLRLCRWSS